MSEPILVLAPRGRDAYVIGKVLSASHHAFETCSDLVELRGKLDYSISGIVLTEEVLVGTDLNGLFSWLDQQPPWSDLPVIVLATKQTGHRSTRSASILDRLGNVVLLERPINAETLSSAVKSAIRARRRQHDARSILARQENVTKELQALNETLEQRVASRTLELQAAHENLEFALDSAGMGSWDLDLGADTSRRSSRYDQIFGYDSALDTWGRQNFLAHVVEDERRSAAAMFDAALRSGSLDAEFHINRLDGQKRTIAAKGHVVYDTDGKPLRMAGIVTDITEREQTERSLYQAQKMEAIGQLTGGVAHDFNNLLTVIVGGLDLIIRHSDQPERVKRLAEAAMTAARRGEKLTQQLLAFSRRQILRPETLNPNRLLLDFESLARRAVGESIELRFDLDPGVFPVRVDPVQLESAVLNLIVNARDAMANGGVISIRSRNTHRNGKEALQSGIAPGAYVMIAVADNGTGIDPQILAHVFEPFFTTKEVGKGSGLGLAQVYGFARSAGGYVSIDSKAGVGTTVSLFFPRSADVVTDYRDTLPEKVPLRRASQGETVLVVEDDEEVLSMAVESLQELLYNVIISRDAQEALRHIDSHARIDIMFSDVVMPGGMNGAQLAREARRLRPELKILLTSGYVGPSGAEAAVEQGLPVLNKPYRRDELAETLRTVLGAPSDVAPGDAR